MTQEQEREQRRTTRRDDADREEATEAVPTAGRARAEALKAEMDDLLDEIDSVLEENAEEFVKGYVQKGGQ